MASNPSAEGVKYAKATEAELGVQPGAVVAWNEGAVFRCPCGERQVYVKSPPHPISFDPDGALDHRWVDRLQRARRPWNELVPLLHLQWRGRDVRRRTVSGSMI